MLPTLGEALQAQLVGQGETMLPGDEVWDSDFDHWELLQSVNFQRKVGPKDVVRRLVFDLRPLVKSMLVQLERFRPHPAMPGEFWQMMDAHVAEAKRRLGLRSFAAVDAETHIATPTALLEEVPPAGQTLSQEVESFARRNRRGGVG